MEKFIAAIVTAAIYFGFIIALIAIFAFPVMWIVNYLFTSTVLLTVFGTSQITFWKAFWLLVLAGFLFKSTNTNKEK